jgi:MFS family permease
VRRLWTAAAAVLLPVLVTAMTGGWRSELPDRIATHWSGSGPADGWSPAGGFWLGMLIAGLVSAVAALVAAGFAARRTGEPARDVRRIAVARGAIVAAVSVAGGAAGIWVATASASLADPVDPRLGWRFVFFLLGMAWGGVAWLIAGRGPRIDVPAEPPVDALDLAPTERAAFSTTLRSPMLLGVTVAAAAVIVVAAVVVLPGLWFAALVPLALGLFVVQVRVTADRRGLRLVAGLAGVTFKRIPLDEILSAETAEINPAEWGGWGYRVMPGRSALILRGGPGLVLNLKDGRRFAVTLDDPRTPAALINGLRAITP